MRLAVFGDVMGKSGRKGLQAHLPSLRTDLRLDFVIANGENAAGGFGITPSTAEDLFQSGVDVITLGNHAFDKAEAHGLLDRDPRVLRPVNAPEKAGWPGRGAFVYALPNGASILVVNVMGRLFMDPLDDPYQAVADVVEASGGLGHGVDAIVVDIHAEATSEKYSMGHALDGEVSLVVGTHTHVPTADAQILENGTGYQTDLGMCGDFDSVIGMKKDEPVSRFTTRLRNGRIEVAEGEATVCGVFADLDPKTGLARKIAPIRIGGRLAPSLPQTTFLHA